MEPLQQNDRQMDPVQQHHRQQEAMLQNDRLLDALRLKGRQMVIFGAVLLLAWAVYELAIRFEEMVTWLTPVHALVKRGRLTWLDYFSEFPWHRLGTHVFLAVCAVFSLLALIMKRGRFSAILMAAIALALIVYSLGSTPLMSASIWQKIKLLPLALIAAGSILRAACAMGRKRRRAP